MRVSKDGAAPRATSPFETAARSRGLLRVRWVGLCLPSYAASGYAASTTYGPPPTEARDEYSTNCETGNGAERK